MQERNHYYPSGLQIDALSSTAAGTSDYTAGWANGQRIPAFAAYAGQLHGRRYLDPAISSWYAVEPLATKFAGVSTYSYALGDPVNLSDATGNMPGPEWQLGLDGSNGLGWADVIGPGGQPRGLSLWQQRGIYVSGNDFYSDGYLAEKLSWEQIKSDFAFENTWYVSATAANRRAVQRGIANGDILNADLSIGLLGTLLSQTTLYSTPEVAWYETDSDGLDWIYTPKFRAAVAITAPQKPLPGIGIAKKAWQAFGTGLGLGVAGLGMAAHKLKSWYEDAQALKELIKEQLTLTTEASAGGEITYKDLGLGTTNYVKGRVSEDPWHFQTLERVYDILSNGTVTIDEPKLRRDGKGNLYSVSFHLAGVLNGHKGSYQVSINLSLDISHVMFNED